MPFFFLYRGIIYRGIIYGVLMCIIYCGIKYGLNNYKYFKIKLDKTWKMDYTIYSKWNTRCGNNKARRTLINVYV